MHITTKLFFFISYSFKIKYVSIPAYAVSSNIVCKQCKKLSYFYFFSKSDQRGSVYLETTMVLNNGRFRLILRVSAA